MQANGVRWFDIDTVWKLAIERQKAGKKPQRRARRMSSHSEGVERVTGAETRQITEWFAAGLSHAEIVLQSGKTHETIRYLYAQYITPSGARLRMTAPSSADDARADGALPEHEPSPAARPRRCAQVTAPRTAAPTASASPVTGADSSAHSGHRSPSAVAVDDDDAGSRRAP